MSFIFTSCVFFESNRDNETENVTPQEQQIAGTWKITEYKIDQISHYDTVLKYKINYPLELKMYPLYSGTHYHSRPFYILFENGDTLGVVGNKGIWAIENKTRRFILNFYPKYYDGDSTTLPSGFDLKEVSKFINTPFGSSTTWDKQIQKNLIILNKDHNNGNHVVKLERQ